MAEAIITAVATVIVAIIGALSGQIGGKAVKREKKQDGDSAWMQDIVDRLLEQQNDALQREREQRRREVWVSCAPLSGISASGLMSCRRSCPA